eukprot:1195078-Prorocentrum_minimum.AAC.5
MEGRSEGVSGPPQDPLRTPSGPPQAHRARGLRLRGGIERGTGVVAGERVSPAGRAVVCVGPREPRLAPVACQAGWPHFTIEIVCIPIQ